MGLLRFTGPDALHFLQGQLTNDTKLLTANSVMLAAYLNPQGRVLALMHLLPHSSGTLAILPRELTQPVAQRMRKYVLRAKVKIEDPGESLVVSGWHGVEALAHAVVPVPPADQQYVEARGIGVAKVGDGSRYWVVAPAAGLPALAEDARLDPEGAHASTVERDWRLADIRAGLPQVYGATSEAFVAQMLNLDLLQGISFSKGCYTGQEIVARTQHLGRIKRRLFHLRLPPRAGAWRIGDELTLSDGRRGRLTEVIAAEHDIEALAVLSLEPQPATDGEPAPGDSAAPLSTTAVQVPLPYALG